MLLSASAVAVLWLRRRSLLDQWLMIVALAALLEMALGSILVSGRFSVGFYAGRLFSLLTSTTVLVVLLAETTRLYANVARSKERKIRRLVDANILGVCISNLEGAIIEANEAFLRMLQYSREDVVSRRLRWTDLTPAEWREQNERSIAELRSTGAFHPIQKEYFRKDGSRVPVLVGGALFEKGGDEGVIFALDLTEIKRAEEALRESEDKLRQIIESAVPGMLWVTGPDGEVTRVNQRTLDYTGARSVKDLLNLGWEKLLHPEDFPKTANAFFHAIQTGESYENLQRVRRVRQGQENCPSLPGKTRQGSVWPCVIPDRASIRTIASAFSRLFTRRSRAERGWACRSAARSSMAMGAGCGSRRTNRAAPCFSSPCRAPTENWTVCRHGSRQRVREWIARQAQAFER